MYSILKANENDKWLFLKNTDGTKYVADTLAEVQEKVKELAKEIPLNEILVVKNCTITESITVVENGANPEEVVEEQTEVQG